MPQPQSAHDAEFNLVDLLHPAVAIATRSPGCPPPQLELALDATILDYLALRVHRTPSEITASGLDRQLERFEEEADKILARAEKALSPLEVTRQELWRMLWEKLRSRPDPAR